MDTEVPVNDICNTDDLEEAGRAYLAADSSGPLVIVDQSNGEYIDPETEIDCVAEAFERWYEAQADRTREEIGSCVMLPTASTEQLMQALRPGVAGSTTGSEPVSEGSTPSAAVVAQPQMDALLRKAFLTWLDLDARFCEGLADTIQGSLIAADPELEAPWIQAYWDHWMQMQDRNWPAFKRDYRNGLVS